MFIDIETVKKERIVVNTDYVMFCSETKKGSEIIMSDGTVIQTIITFNDMLKNFN